MIEDRILDPEHVFGTINRDAIESKGEIAGVLRLQFWVMEKSYRTTAIATAVLFLLTDVTAIVGLLLYQPLLTNPKFITSMNVNTTHILIGAFLELMLSVVS